MEPLTRVLKHRLDTSLEAEFTLPIVQIHSQIWARFLILFETAFLRDSNAHGKIVSLARQGRK